MRDREVVSSDIGCRCVFVYKWLVGVVYDLGVSVVFHHDKKYVIEVRDSSRDRAFRGRRHTGDAGGQQANRQSGGFHELILSCVNTAAPSRRSTATLPHLCGGRWPRFRNISVPVGWLGSVCHPRRSRRLASSANGRCETCFP
jgi:hypothetical protein